MKKRSRIIIIWLLVAIILSLAVAYFTGGLVPNRWAAGSYPVRGVDVSHYQGTINWTGVESDHIDFAYIKATEGGSTRDARFAANWQSAAAHGIRRGAYHFFTLRMPG